MRYNLKGGHMVSPIEYEDYLVERGYDVEKINRYVGILYGNKSDQRSEGMGGEFYE